MCNLVENVNTVRERFNKFTIQVNAVFFLLNVEEEIREIEIVHPVLLQVLKYFPIISVD